MLENQKDTPIGVSAVAKPKQGTDSPTKQEGERQTSNLRLRWNWAEASIWSESMLTALENGVKGGKWFSLIDKVTRPKTLLSAWEKVRGNRGAGGVDGININKFEANCFRYLDEIRTALMNGTYHPLPVRRVYIPKSNGDKRPLGIPALKDRVVQMAIKMTIEPIFEKEFHNNSYGFRPQRGAKDALRHVDNLLREGYSHVVDVDFKAFFDTIPHDMLQALVETRVSDSRVLKLIKLFLKQGIMESLREWTPIQGTPQGGVISPLLANIYLNPLDQLMASRDIPMVRYADDFVIFTKSAQQAQEIKDLVEQWSKAVGLTVHPEKSRIVDYSAGEGVEFLGYCFQKGNRFIRKSSLKKLRDTIRTKTPRTAGASLEVIIANLNRTLRGWYGYFKHVQYQSLKSVDQFVRRRLRAILRKREKRPGFGANQQDHRRWRNAYFAELGLFATLEAQTKEVKERIRLMACQSR